MFETEAKEICSKYFEENCYKKNKWADTHDLVAMWQDGYNKANEWYYCEDELPDHNGQFYVALKGQTETFILNYDYDEYEDGDKLMWIDDEGTHFDDVYAWREKLRAPKER